jgi:homoserine kinase
LPPTVPHADAAFNVAATGGLVLGLHTGNTKLIAAGMHDRLHEPYRARLFPHLEILISAARGAGALGACLSGAGPSVLALTQPDRTEDVVGAFRAAAASMGVAGEVKQLAVAPAGAEIVEESGRVTRPADELEPR